MPTDPIVVSYSEIASFRQCPHQHKLGYKERWAGPTTSPALLKGTLWHKVLEWHYRWLKDQPGDLDGAVRAGRQQIVQARREGFDEVADLVEWMYAGYIDMYGADKDWEILAVEQKIEVPLLTARGHRSRFRLKMQIDLLVRDAAMRGKLVMVDHKSGQNLPSEAELDMADQFGLYIWGLKHVGYDMFAGLWNGARTQRNKTAGQTLESRFRRFPLARTDFELNTIATEAYATARKMWAAGELAERHPDKDRCKWMCQFRDACLLGRKTGEDRERRYLLDTGWSPGAERH